MPKKPNLKTRRGSDAEPVNYYRPSNAVASQALEESGIVSHTSARTRFSDIEPGISVRQGMDSFNWGFFRPGEHVPRRKNEMLRVSDEVYRFNGIVKFVIDMMADFVTQGVEVYHPSARWQKTYRNWWKKVSGQFVSERLVNLLYRNGVAVVKRNFGTLNAGDINDLEQGVAADLRTNLPTGLSDSVKESKEMIEKDIKFDRSFKPGRNRIPLKYTFINPVQVEAVGGEIALFAGEPEFGLKLPETLVKAIKNAKTIEEKMIIANLPSYITNAIGQGKSLIPLDKDKVSVHFYKKDDWQIWADPLVLSVLKDIILYEKMKDADRATLDTMIRQIRLWKLGLPEHKIQPGKGHFQRLKNQLLAAQSGASIDLVWDAAIDLQCSSTDGHQWLGIEKYQPVLQAIYAGLGIPQSLTGGQGGSGGMTNNALSLKTLIERLQYARNMLVEFWEREFYVLQRAFGHRQPARLRFDLMSMSDEASEKMLWINLWDRNIVTTETMREKFGLLNEVEVARLVREYKMADGGKVPHKIGAFTEAQPHPDQLTRAAMVQGSIAPSEAGVKTKPKKKGDKSMLDRQDEQQEQQIDLQKEQMANDQKLAEKQQKVDEKQGDDLHKQKLQQNDDLHKQRLGQKDAEHKAALPIKTAALKKKVSAKGQPGRPVNSKDSGARKKRTPKVAAASFLACQVRARETFRHISEYGTAAYLAGCGKKNLRQLTSAQAEELELRKFSALCGGETTAQAAWDGASPAPLPEVQGVLEELVRASYGGRGVSPSVEEMREMYVSAYASWQSQQLESEHDGQA